MLASKLVVQRQSEEAFAPEQPITRAEFSALIVRSLGLSEDHTGAAFNDVSVADWHAGVIGAAAQAGLIEGLTYRRFDPSSPISREQMSVMIARAVKASGQTPSSTMKSGLAFSDTSSISDWALESIQQLMDAGLLQGQTGNRLAPADQATRAEAAVLIKRFLQHVKFINECVGIR